MAGLLPTWVPTDALLVAVAVALAAILVMNRGSPWFINAKAQDEPILVGLGVFLVLGAGWFVNTVGLSMIPERFWMAAGLLAIAIGLFARYTDLLDISGLV